MQQVLARDWSFSSCGVDDDTLTWIELRVPLQFPFNEVDQGPAVISEHLVSWRLPNRWPYRQRTTVPLI